MSGDHEVHDLENPCHEMPAPENQHYLGKFPNCHFGVAAAQNLGFPKVNGCRWCCRPCHTT
ncbi:MAG: hypothetical protein F4103_13005 [Boseongicola sp. SB0673_bin_14]|nr:hypothetical protein [Gammaproteobacteria bacterium]MYI69611.1 hypothetical protein [Boseongicola sp. SB0673_bin_14]